MTDELLVRAQAEYREGRRGSSRHLQRDRPPMKSESDCTLAIQSRAGFSPTKSRAKIAARLATTGATDGGVLGLAPQPHLDHHLSTSLEDIEDGANTAKFPHHSRLWRPSAVQVIFAQSTAHSPSLLGTATDKPLPLNPAAETASGVISNPLSPS